MICSTLANDTAKRDPERVGEGVPDSELTKKIDALSVCVDRDHRDRLS